MFHHFQSMTYWKNRRRKEPEEITQLKSGKSSEPNLDVVWVQNVNFGPFVWGTKPPRPFFLGSNGSRRPCGVTFFEMVFFHDVALGSKG